MPWPKGRKRTSPHLCKTCGGSVAIFKARVNLYPMGLQRGVKKFQYYGDSFELCEVCSLSDPHGLFGMLIMAQLSVSLREALCRYADVNEFSSEVA